MSGSALLLIDIQNDFCSNGALAVPEADSIIPVVNKLQTRFDLVVATQDWHPAHHASFASTHHKQVGETIHLTVGNKTIDQFLWPDHCTQNTHGSEFHPELNQRFIKRVFQKGIDPMLDSYSAFFDNAHLRQTGLHNYLQQSDVKTVYLAGLATDYCVKFTAIDAADLGYNVYVINDACKGVGVNEGDIEKACTDMQAHGVKLISSSDISA